MIARAALLSGVLVCLAPAGQADPFRGLTTADRANLVDVVLGSPASDTTNAEGVRFREYDIDGGATGSMHSVLVWNDASGATLAIRTEVYRSENGVEIGVTTLADILEQVGGRAAMGLADTLMLPDDGNWSWRVTWPVSGVPREYLQLTFTADALPDGQPSTFVPDDAILSAIMVMSMSTADQMLDLPSLNRAEQRQMGSAIRDLLSQ